MPKIIENLKERLIAEAQKQIEDSGYSAVTIRSVAKACGVGVGTVYNYFPSKEALVATHLLEDWNLSVQIINRTAQGATEPMPAMKCIYDQLVSFSRRHQVIFRDETATAGFAGSFSQYHELLRSQLAEPLRKFCADDFTPQFAAESLLTWTMAGKSFEEIFEILKKLF
jgi:AcrR family transcriptional regulator